MNDAAETIRKLTEENGRLREALEWAVNEMQNGDNRWFENSQPGEKYYDWFARTLRARAGIQNSSPTPAETT